MFFVSTAPCQTRCLMPSKTSLTQRPKMSLSVKSTPTNPRKWQCMSHCGACCKLNDFDQDVLRDMLKSEVDVVEYLDMIGTDGWCKWFDSHSRKCTIYSNRPRFCRATPQVFEDLYNVKREQFDEFAISCCEFHIANSYGEESHEAFRYDWFKDSSCEQIPPRADESD